MNKKICFISGDYPEEGRPVFTFVKNIVDALADNGNDCTVIAPFSITKNKRLHKIRETYKTLNGALVKVYRPNIITMSNYKIMGFRPSSFFFNRAVCSVLRKFKKKTRCYIRSFLEKCTKCLQICTKKQYSIICSNR